MDRRKYSMRKYIYISRDIIFVNREYSKPRILFTDDPAQASDLLVLSSSGREKGKKIRLLRQ